MRQLADEGGAATLAQSYRPYGSLLHMEGDAESIYGFTGQQMDGTGLVYLRARYYAPAQARFISRDAWEGDARLPMSRNLWLYSLSNPVNRTDPSGLFPTWCQARPSRALFEDCVLKQYKVIWAIDEATLGTGIAGSRGCYRDEFRYRAAGYIEGSETSIWVIWWGHERVYNFARMESLSFDYKGFGVSTSVLGGAIVDHGGCAFGLKSTTPLAEHYKGVASTVGIGVGFSGTGWGIPLGVATGLSGFVSWGDTKLWGLTWYVGGSVAYSPELVDASLGIMLNFVPSVGTWSDYTYNNGAEVNEGALLASIGVGWKSPWRINLEETRSSQMLSRAAAASVALYYAHVHEELHEISD